MACTKARYVRISKNLSFGAAHDSHLTRQERPLVLLYGWVSAKDKHIDKYGDFYLKKGFDVLTITVTTLQLVRPTLAHGVIKQVLDFTKLTEHWQQPLLIHGFSVGACLFGETVSQIGKVETFKDHYRRRIRGAIIDSFIDLPDLNVPYSLCQGVTDIPPLQKVVEASLKLYIAITKSWLKVHRGSFEAFWANEFRIPTLFLYSLTLSKFGPAEQTEQVSTLISLIMTVKIKSATVRELKAKAVKVKTLKFQAE